MFVVLCFAAALVMRAEISYKKYIYIAVLFPLFCTVHVVPVIFVFYIESVSSSLQRRRFHRCGKCVSSAEHSDCINYFKDRVVGVVEVRVVSVAPG